MSRGPIVQPEPPAVVPGMPEQERYTVLPYAERFPDRPDSAFNNWYTNVILPRRAANPLSDEVKASIIAAEIALFGHRRTFD